MSSGSKLNLEELKAQSDHLRVKPSQAAWLKLNQRLKEIKVKKSISQRRDFWVRGIGIAASLMFLITFGYMSFIFLFSKPDLHLVGNHRFEIKNLDGDFSDVSSQLAMVRKINQSRYKAVSEGDYSSRLILAKQYAQNNGRNQKVGTLERAHSSHSHNDNIQNIDASFNDFAWLNGRWRSKSFQSLLVEEWDYDVSGALTNLSSSNYIDGFPFVIGFLCYDVTCKAKLSVDNLGETQVYELKGKNSAFEFDFAGRKNLFPEHVSLKRVKSQEYRLELNGGVISDRQLKYFMKNGFLLGEGGVLYRTMIMIVN